MLFCKIKLLKILPVYFFKIFSQCPTINIFLCSLSLLTALDSINFFHIYQGLRIGLEKKCFLTIWLCISLNSTASGVKSPHCPFAFLLVRIDFHSFCLFFFWPHSKACGTSLTRNQIHTLCSGNSES